MRSDVGNSEYANFPGGDLVAAGLADLRAGRDSTAALLVSIAATRLRRAGVDIPPPIADANARLYRELQAAHGDAAHSKYNALVRRLVSFARAIESSTRLHA